MTDTTEVATQIVKDVLQACLNLPWSDVAELDSEAAAVVRQLPRIRSHRDATLAIRRVFEASFGAAVPLAETELALAGRLLALRLRSAGLIGSPLTLEGYTSEELLALVNSELQGSVFSGDPLVFSVGSAQVLGSFRIEGARVIAELAHVDGGGEGVLSFLSGLIQKFAVGHDIATIEWIVHALTCAAPNAKLRALLERRGFIPAQHNSRPVLRLVEPVRGD